MNPHSVNHLVVVSGRSGSGKSTALQVLEDCGFYCVDNLPVGLLTDLIKRIESDHEARINRIAIGVDARNVRSELVNVPPVLDAIQEQVDKLDVIYLDANESILINRFSATRRKHPLSSSKRSLTDAMAMEKDLLEPIANQSNLTINTSELSVHQLRERIKTQIRDTKEATEMALIIQSFGFKHGTPPDADFVFDVRCLPNPYWIPALRSYTGQDKGVVEFLENETSVKQMGNDILLFIKKWLPVFEQNDRSYLTVAIGCTGGQHRSVYIAEWLEKQFAQQKKSAQIRHRELDPSDE